MKALTLTRFYHPVWGTFGELHGDSALNLVTIEQPWEGNKPFHSCIPEGIYRVIRDSRHDHPRTFCVINNELGVSQYPKNGFRHSILIHVANTMYDVVGCIGTGLDFYHSFRVEYRGKVFEWPGVANSRRAFELLDHYIGNDQEFELEIRQYKPGMAQVFV